MNDYMWLIIIFVMFFVIFVALCKGKLNYVKRRKEDHEIMTDQYDQRQNDLVAIEKEIYDKLMTLEPFDYGGKDMVSVGPLICDPEPGLIITGLFRARFRDVMRPRFHGLQGRVKVRQASRLISSNDGTGVRFGNFSEWDELGPVKKEL